MTLDRSFVKEAALEGFADLGYSIDHVAHLAPFGEVVLLGRFRESIRQLNPAVFHFPSRNPARHTAAEITERGVDRPHRL